MSRTIKDSITALESSLDSCKTSLENKAVTVETRPKASELPTLIDSIQAGGGDNPNVTVVYEYYEGNYSDEGSIDPPTCSLKSPDSQKEYQGNSSIRWAENFEEGYDAYVTVEIPVPKAELDKKGTMLDLYTDGSRKTYFEITNKGFIIRYDTVLKKADSDERTGYLSLNNQTGEVKIDGKTSGTYGYYLNTYETSYKDIKGGEGIELYSIYSYCHFKNTDPEIIVSYNGCASIPKYTK